MPIENCLFFQRVKLSVVYLVNANLRPTSTDSTSVCGEVPVTFVVLQIIPLFVMKVLTLCVVLPIVPLFVMKVLSLCVVLQIVPLFVMKVLSLCVVLQIVPPFVMKVLSLCVVLQIVPLFVMKVLSWPGVPGLFLASIFSGSLR